MADATQETEKAQIERRGGRAFWVDEIQSAKKRENQYRKDADMVNRVYEGQSKTAYSDSEATTKKASAFNILYSNTETLMPALYNSTPRPVVQRRFKDPDPLGLQAAKAVQRVLAFSIDSGDGEYSPFDEIMEQAVLEACVPGRGVSWVKYDADFELVGGGKDERVESDPDVLPDAAQDQEQVEPHERVKYESNCFEAVPWDRFLCGYGRKWSDVPWVGREHLMTAEELIANFGKEKAARCKLINPLSGSWDESQGQRSGENDVTGSVSVAFVYEIWDKVRRKVVFVSEQFEDGLLKEVEDPLKLTGFFPCPKPLQFVAKVTDMTPIPLYMMYADQARELNSITVRLKYLIRALKVRGYYNAAIQEMENVLTADDNELLPAQNVAALEGKGLDSMLWLVPIDMIVQVVQQLYVQRGQVKQVIYEITGIADIMRGSTNAAETAEAQSIKNQWGTLRIKRLQRQVQRHARDLLRIAAEIACKKFSEKTFASMTGLPYPTSEQKQQAQQQLQQLAQMPQQVGPDGQPMPNPQMQQLQQVIGQPSWGDILGVLRDDLLRNYKIDIETNSTIDLDATEDKKEIGEFLNAMAQLLNGINPAVESGLFTEDVAKQLVMTILRRFRFTDEVEPLLEEAQKPQQKGPDPKAQAEMAKSQAEIQRVQLEGQIAQQQAQADMARIKMDQETMRMKAEFEQQEHQMKMQELVMKNEAMRAKHAQTMAQMAAKAAMPAQKAAV